MSQLKFIKLVKANHSQELVKSQSQLVKALENEKIEQSVIRSFFNSPFTVGSKGKVDTWSWFVSDSLNKNAFPTQNHLSDWSISF